MANSTFLIQSQVENAQYRFTNGVLAVHGNYVRNMMTGQVAEIHGQMFVYDSQKEQQGYEGDFFCQFDGALKNDKLCYVLSALQHDDSDTAWAAIDEIEANVTGEGE